MDKDKEYATPISLHWSDVNGKTLEIRTIEDTNDGVKVFMTVGIDRAENRVYILHTEAEFEGVKKS